KTRQIVATVIDDKGQATQHVVDPQAIPQLLKSAQDGSAYWNAIFQIGQPRLAEQQMANEGKLARGAASKEEQRAYQEDWERRRHERDRQEKLSDQEAAGQAGLDKENRAAARWIKEHNLVQDEGQTAGERNRNQLDSYFQDLSGAIQHAPTPQDKQQLLTQGLGYRFENTGDRQQPLVDDDLQFLDQATKERFAADMPTLQSIARSIGVKTGKLDASGAMNVTAALISDPELRINTNGTIEGGGVNLVFNPALLPQLDMLRKKYRAQ